MDVKLKVTDGKRAGQKIPISGEKFVIGRADDCHLRPGSAEVSRHHCVIAIDGRRVSIRDYGSRNGTYVNGERITGETELSHGDTLQVASLKFEIVTIDTLGGKKKPKVKNIHEAAARTAEHGSPREMDIESWLDDEAEEDDTTTLTTYDTSMINVSDLNSPPKASSEDTTDEESPAGHDTTDESTPKAENQQIRSGEGTRDPDHVDSKSAAEAMLRKLQRGS
jgi:pSer/pThr/pTyr-binding forkhead associated (FHA) protein